MFFPLRIHICLTVALFLFAIGGARGIILFRTGDPAANTAAPGGSLAGSGWQYEGSFGDYLGTPIAPHFFITAQHIGFNSIISSSGARISPSPNPSMILGPIFVSLRSPKHFFAPLYTGSDEAGKHLVVIGRGTQRGAAVTSDGVTRGWRWGASDRVQRWGENIVASTPQRPPGGDMLYALFNASGLPFECHLSNGDSGGAVFLDDRRDG